MWLIYAAYEGQTNVIVCPSKLIYHLPCPGCGITRATLKFLHCDFIGALRMNPNVIISISFLVGSPVILAIDFLTTSHLTANLYNSMEKLLRKYAIAIPFYIIELCIWIHNIITGI